MDVPLFAHFLQASEKINWHYKSEKSENECLAMKNNQCNLPRGKVMGGSSVLNNMMYTRGNKKDFEDWEKMGNPGWSFDDILPYFKKFENYQMPSFDSKNYGKSGPVQVSYLSFRSKLSTIFIDGMKELGLPEVNYNGERQVGVSHIENTTQNGYRVSSNRAYIDPILARPNLHVQSSTLVTKILMDDTTKVATGVEFYHNQKLHTIQAKREVILSAGAMNSPQLLMLSGVGPSEHLAENGIQTIVDLPVGENFMDHVAPGFSFKINDFETPIDEAKEIQSAMSFIFNQSGPYTMIGGPEAIAFFDSNDFTNPNAYPDLEILEIAGTLAESPVVRENLNLKDDLFEKLFQPLQDQKISTISIAGFILRPKSRGVIKLKNKNPFDHPLIYPNYYSHPDDVRLGIKLDENILALEHTEAFKQVNATHYNATPPDCSNFDYGSAMHWECYLRYYTHKFYHYSGTCKMGPQSDKSSVVDSRLRVLGIKNLRVADASIMHVIVSGHPNAAVYMIAEKAADLIKQDWNFS